MKRACLLFYLVAGLSVSLGARAGAPSLQQALEDDPVAPQEPGLWPLVRTEQAGIVLWHPESTRDGRLMIVEVAAGDACREPRVEWGGQVFRTYPLGSHAQALLPVPLGAPPGQKLLWVDCSDVRTSATVEVFEGDYPETKLTVSPKFTKKPPRRVHREAASIEKALATATEGRLWARSFVIPTPGPQTSPFGVRRTFNGKLSSRHRGLDLDGKVGAPVVAANDGVVVLVARRYYYTGNALFIDHGDRLFTLYLHLSQIHVEQGDRVERGQLIGAIGRSGRVTGPHLHFAVKVAGSYVDPRDMLAYDPTRMMSGAPIDH